MSLLHRIEKYGNNHIEGPFLELSFDTEYRGIWQCHLALNGMSQFSSEPPLESLKKEEQEAIKEIGMVVFYFTHGKVPNI